MVALNPRKVAPVLFKDPALVKNWKQFLDRLDLRDGSATQIEMQHNAGETTNYELFANILEVCRSENGGYATLDTLCEILESEGYQNASEALKIQSDRGSPSQPLWFEMKLPTSNFVGRVKVIQQLRTFYSSSIFLVTICGMGGVGKSSLANVFAHELRKQHTFNCLWLEGDTLETLTNSVIRLANDIKISAVDEYNRPKDILNIFSDSIKLLTKKSRLLRTLMIVDNVDKENGLVTKLLTDFVKSHCFVLLTSRNLGVLDTAGEIISLDVLDDSEAATLIRNSFTDESDLDVVQLCQMTQNFPLALQQAVAYIKKQKRLGVIGEVYKVHDYLAEFKEQKEKLLSFPLNEVENDYRESTLVTWNVSIRKILEYGKVGQMAIKILNGISFFEPDGMHIDLIQKYAAEDITAVEALCLLKAYCLVKIDNRVISIHRLIQLIVRLQLSSSHQDVPVLRSLLIRTKEIFKELKQRDIPHILSLSKFFFNSQEQLLEGFERFPNQIVQVLRDLSMYREMQEFANQSELFLTDVLGDSHLETLAMGGQVANALEWNGKFEDSFNRHKILYERISDTLGEEHQETLLIGHNMASVLWKLKKYDESLCLLKRVLETEKKHLEENDPLTMATKHEIAIVIMDKGLHSEAMKMYAEVLGQQTKKFGETHPHVLKTRHDIGVCLYRQRRFHEAQEIFQGTLLLKEKMLGKEHSETLRTKYISGLTFYRMGKKDEGLLIMNQVLRSREKILGEDHPDCKRIQREIIYFSCIKCNVIM